MTKVSVNKAINPKSELLSKAVLPMSRQARIHNSFDMALQPKPQVLKFSAKLKIRAELFKVTAEACLKKAVPQVELPEFNFSFSPLKTAMSLALVVGLLLQSAALNTPKTFAYFSDTAQSEGNTITAGTLSMSLTSTAWTPTDKVSALKPGDSISRPVTVNKTGSLGFRYDVKFAKTSGDDAFCNALLISADLSGESKITNNQLSTAVMGPVEFSDPEVWTFTVTLPSSATGLEGKSCGFDLVFDAWQTTLDFGNGFSDQEELSNTLTAYSPILTSGVRMNEILPNPNGNDNQSEGASEWIELYNNSATEAVNLTGYYITDYQNHRIDIEACRTNTGVVTISPHGYLVVYVDGGDDCNTHNFQLNNNGDTITLYNSSNQRIDWYSYGDQDNLCILNPTPGGDNPDTTSNTTCNGAVKENKSIARIPDGWGEWVDPVPTPGQPNILEEEPAAAPLATMAQGSGGLEASLEGETLGGETTTADETGAGEDQSGNEDEGTGDENMPEDPAILPDTSRDDQEPPAVPEEEINPEVTEGGQPENKPEEAPTGNPETPDGGQQ